jgi:DNA-binding response OmpR family regulator
MLVRAMRNLGFAPLQAGDGAEGLKVLEEHPEVVLVMADIQMPVMNGVKMLEEIRARWPQTAVMMVSGLGDDEVAMGCVSKGAMDYIHKPFDVEMLRTRVANVLARRRQMMDDASGGKENSGGMVSG